MFCLGGVSQGIDIDIAVLTLLQGINGLSALNEAIPKDIKEALGASPHLRCAH
jgi:hypothetical protein